MPTSPIFFSLTGSIKLIDSLDSSRSSPSPDHKAVSQFIYGSTGVRWNRLTTPHRSIPGATAACLNHASFPAGVCACAKAQHAGAGHMRCTHYLRHGARRLALCLHLSACFSLALSPLSPTTKQASYVQKLCGNVKNRSNVTAMQRKCVFNTRNRIRICRLSLSRSLSFARSKLG